MHAMTKIKSYLNELALTIDKEELAEDLYVVSDKENGINNMVIDIEDPLVVLEQFIIAVPKSDTADFYRWLLQKNRMLVHGAYVLDEQAERVYFRDTLQLQNLDLNELEASIKSLSLALAEMGKELIIFAKK